MQTNLSKKINFCDNKSQYDAYCKILLSDKNILAWILKATVYEYSDCSIEDIKNFYIEGTPNISAVNIKPSEVTASITGMRNEDTIPAEGIFNGSRMISAQCERDFSHSHYEKINKVYSIWICMNPPAKDSNSITSIHFMKENVLGNVHINHFAYDLITVLLIRLGGEKYENYIGIIKLPDTLLSPRISAECKKEILQSDFNIPMTTSFKKEIDNMCNLSDGVYNLGFDSGFNDGFNDALSQSFKPIIKLCKELNLSKDDTIQKTLNTSTLPEKYVRKLVEQYW